jgi:DNA-binding CsgD family transcriptional regulator
MQKGRVAADTARGGLAASRAGPPALARSGAELVYVAEELYLRIFVLALLLTLVGCVLSIVSAAITPPTALTDMFAAVGLVVSGGALVRRRAAYCWLRRSTTHQLAPAALAVIALLADGPRSSAWWMALPLLWIVAVTSSIRVTAAASVATAVAYLAGTVLRGAPLIDGEDAGVIASAVALPADAVVCYLVVEVFGRFVLHLHRLERSVQPTAARPPPVAGIAALPAPPAAPPPRSEPTPAISRPLSKLTARQLEVALLTSDGLRRGEVALCLGISAHQVERLLREARARVGAANANELVAMLVKGQLAPEA